MAAERSPTPTLYATNYEHGAVLRRGTDCAWETIARRPEMLFVATLSLAADGFLYLTSNQLHRMPGFVGEEDLREPPYALLRVRTDSTPVRLH